MKITCQESLVPGESLIEKWELLAEAGWDGFELLGRGDGAFRARADELKAARNAGVLLRTVCVIGEKFIGDPDPDRRADAIASMKELLSGIAEVGGVGAITPATCAEPPIASGRTPEDDREALVPALAELGEHAEREGVLLLLEPLNRYEDSMLNTLAQGVELAEASGSDAVKLMADLYHMNIEEADPLGALRDAAPRLAHVHLSDSNRGEPFAGHIDWAGVLATLADIGYDGDLALECGLSGDARAVLPEVTRRLRELPSLAGAR